VEDQPERITAMLNERAALLQPLCEMLSENAYYNLIQEMAAELSEIYGHKFDLAYEPLTNGQRKPTKKAKTECNANCTQAIKWAKYVLDWMYKSEDKFEYVPVVINLELQSASRWTKIFVQTPQEGIENHKNALRGYERVRKFVDEFKKSKGVKNDAECLSQEGVT
jgi:hypothetical protein